MPWEGWYITFTVSGFLLFLLEMSLILQHALGALLKHTLLTLLDVTELLQEVPFCKMLPT